MSQKFNTKKLIHIPNAVNSILTNREVFVSEVLANWKEGEIVGAKNRKTTT